jgi:ABC-type transport system involved in multi-copper enzyme maturation permease subunit
VNPLGPLFIWELRRLSRGTATARLRTAYGLALLATLFAVYWSWFGDRLGSGQTLDAQSMARWSESFAGAFFAAQCWAALLLTPALTATTIVGERERGTLLPLLTAPLRDHEILFGKLLARLTAVGGILLTGLPVLALSLLWGGVEPRLVLAEFAATGLVLLAVGAAALFVSVSCPGTRSAVVLAYVLTLPAALCLVGGSVQSGRAVSLIGVILEAQTDFGRAGSAPFAERLADALAVVVGVSGSVAVFCLAAAWVWFRRLAAAEPVHAPASREEAEAWTHRPPVTDRPLLWKEIAVGDWLGHHLAQMTRREKVLSAVPFVALLLMCCFIVAGHIIDGIDRNTAALVRLGLGLLVGWVCLLAAVSAVRCVIRERERRTLDALLALSVERDEILAAKWWGSLLRHRRALALLGTVWLLTLITFDLHWLALPAIVLASAAHLAFSLSAGLWLSVVCRSGVRALMALAGLALGLMVGMFGVPTLLAPVPGHLTYLGYLFWPPAAWGVTALSRSDWTDRPQTVVAAVLVCLINAAVYGTMAWLLWLDAVRRFRREGMSPGRTARRAAP